MKKRFLFLFCTFHFLALKTAEKASDQLLELEKKVLLHKEAATVSLINLIRLELIMSCEQKKTLTEVANEYKLSENAIEQTGLFLSNGSFDRQLCRKLRDKIYIQRLNKVGASTYFFKDIVFN